MQVVPWLGVVPNKAGQLQQLLCDDNYSPLVSLFKEATHEILTNPASTLNANSFLSMSKQAEVVGKVNSLKTHFLNATLIHALSLSLSLSLFPKVVSLIFCHGFHLIWPTFQGLRFKVLEVKV
jgi:hypothetical protein